MSKLYVDVDDPITLMEMMDSESFQMILMEPPFNTGNSKRWLYECGEKKEDEEY